MITHLQPARTRVDHSRIEPARILSAPAPCQQRQNSETRTWSSIEVGLARLVLIAIVFSLGTASLVGAPLPTLPPPSPKKLERVADPSPELFKELFQFDKNYRHGTPEQFAELEKRAEALAKQYPARDNQARIWCEVAHVGGQSRIDMHADLVRKYAMKGLEISRDPLQRGQMYSLLASTVDVSGLAFPKGRRQAAEFLLAGYRELLAQELPDKASDLPGVSKIGGLIGRGDVEEAQARAEHAAQMAAREEAKFIQAQIERRETLVMQLRDLYKPEPKRHGRNPEGPMELRVLAAKTMTNLQVDALIKKVME